MFNLNLYPINIREGKSEKTLPGLFALTPPRRCARGRENDQLFGLIHLTGRTSITPEALQDWLLKKAALFYRAPGTVTNAMRFVAEAINSELLDRNVKRAKDGSQVNGSLCLGVIRKKTLYMLIIGQARIFVLTGQGTSEFEDKENHPRGLGMNESVLCRFSQIEIDENDAILLAPLANKAWSVDSLKGGSALSIDALSRRLFNQAPLNLPGSLVRLTPGNGQVTFHTLRFSEGNLENQPEAQPVQKQPESNVPEAAPLDVGNELEQPAKPVEITKVNIAEILSKEEELPGTAVNEPLDTTEPVVDLEGIKPTSERLSVERPARKPAPEPGVSSEEVKAQVGSYVKAVDEFRSKTKTTVSKFLTRLLPGTQGDSPAIPRSIKLLVAIAMPLLVVGLASSVYLSKGKSQQFDLYYLQGQQYAAQAESLINDPSAHLASLVQALNSLDKAAQYGQTAEFLALKNKIQGEMDSIQGIVRLYVSPISSIGFSEDVHITQMAATATDLYLLDEITGRALRYYLSGSEYVQDKGFDCGPNPANPLNSIGNLVDIVPLSVGNSFNATLLAIDAIGNIEFCNPDESGIVGALVPPDAGWKRIRSISIFQNYLYVLDPEMNAVYRFQEVDNVYGEKPTLFFDSTIPPLSLAIEIEVNNDELYILRSTGDMVECTYSHMKDYKETECNDPAPYGDMRTGQNPQAISFPNAKFIQMRMTSAPDSSLYLLDESGKNFYHFSLQRNLQKILQPGFSDPGLIPEGAPTAMVVSPGKIVFLAYGNQIFHAPLP